METENQPPASGHPPTSLARKAGIFTVSRAVTILTQMLAGVVLTHALSEADAGIVFYLVLLLYGTALTFGQLGLPDSVFFFFEKLPPAARKSFTLLLSKTLLRLAFAAAAIMLAIGWLGSSQEGFGEVRTLIWAVMAMLLFELPTMPLPNVLIALDRAKAAAWLNIFTGLTQFMAMALPLLLPDPVAAIPIGLLVYSILRMVVSTAIFRKLFRNEPTEPLPDGTLREVFRYSLPLSLAQIFWTLNRQVDKYVVQWFLPAFFAVYSAGALEIPIIPTIAYSVAAVMMPQLVGHHLRGERSQLLELWYRSIRKVTVIVLPLVMVFVVAAEEFIALLFPDNYADAVIPFRIYTLILLQRVASYSNMQKALGSTGDITRAAIYLFSINALLAVPLVLWLGMAGPPLAALLANTFSWWYALRKIQLLLKVKFREVFPFGFYGKALGVAALAAVPVFLLKQQVEMPAAIGFAMLAVCYLLVYLLLARLTGIVPEEDWRRLLRR
ncbi:MAG: oligosaccharide flippase family protein [Bacteroidetes bacterium]|nr:oligosaccharide flippase family protein [Bacteroidota bacterium]